MLQEGIKNLYLERLFQRDGIALTEIAGDETSVRVPSHGTVQTEDSPVQVPSVLYKTSEACWSSIDHR
jgi:hypothetical protein